MAPTYRNFIYMEDQGVIFAYIPRAASTGWKCVLRRMAGHEDWRDPRLAHDKINGGLRYLDLDSDDVKLLHRPGISKYAMVRNPYTRALSAYLGKVHSRLPVRPEGEGDRFDRIVRAIDEFRREAFGGGAHSAITFEVFLLWLRMSESQYVNDEYFAPQTSLLRYPEVKFDLIGRMEGLDGESGRILEAIGYPGEFPMQSDIGVETSHANEKAVEYYNIKTEFLAHLCFEEDFAAFGYHSRTQIGPSKVSQKLT